MAEEQQDYITPLLSEFNTKLVDIEEKQRLSKERVLLISQNLVELREEFNKTRTELKISIEEMKGDIEKMKRGIIRVAEEIEKRAKKSEVEILNNQMKMFSPLEFARIQDVQKMIHHRSSR